MDCSPRLLLGILIFQTRILEWVAISFSRGPSWPRTHWRVDALPLSQGSPVISRPCHKEWIGFCLDKAPELRPWAICLRRLGALSSLHRLCPWSTLLVVDQQAQANSCFSGWFPVLYLGFCLFVLGWFFFFFFFLAEPWGFLIPQPGIKPHAPCSGSTEF